MRTFRFIVPHNVTLWDVNRRWHWESYGMTGCPMDMTSSTSIFFNSDGHHCCCTRHCWRGSPVLGVLTTGYGKSLPMLVLALLLPPGKESVKTMCTAIAALCG